MWGGTAAVTDNAAGCARRLARKLAAGVALAIAAWAPAAASAATPVAYEFDPLPIADAEPSDITTGPDGNLWYLKVDDAAFPDPTKDLVGRITPAGVVTQSELGVDRYPLGITAGPDGNVWFTQEDPPLVTSVTPTTPLVVTDFITLPGLAAPIGITAGPDGHLWYADARAGDDFVSRFTMPPPPGPPAGEVLEYSIGADSNPSDITVGPDGNLWFTEPTTNSIGRITVGGNVLTDVPVPTANAQPTRITTGPDGNLWFTEQVGNKIGRINPNTLAVTEFPLSADPAPRTPFGIAAGPDGNLWFTEVTGPNQGAIGRIDPTTGDVTEFTAGISPFASLRGVTAGPDGNLWFTEKSGNRIGRINTALDPAAHRNPSPIAIPAIGSATPYPSEITVSGLQGTITGLRVELTGIGHAHPDDIDALLVGPQGQKALLVADVGGTSVAAGATLNVLDSAPYTLLAGGPLVSGMFRPTNGPGADVFPGPAPAGPYADSLASFNGSDPNGTWQLFVADDTAASNGAMHGGWGLKSPPPRPVEEAAMAMAEAEAATEAAEAAMAEAEAEPTPPIPTRQSTGRRRRRARRGR